MGWKRLFLTAYALSVISIGSAFAQTSSGFNINSAMKAASAPEAICERGGAYRLHYDYELAHCAYTGPYFNTRIATVRSGVLFELEQKRSYRSPDAKAQLLAQLKRLVAFYGNFGFTEANVSACIANAAKRAYRFKHASVYAQLQAHASGSGVPKAEVRNKNWVVDCQKQTDTLLEIVLSHNNRF